LVDEENRISPAAPLAVAEWKRRGPRRVRTPLRECAGLRDAPAKGCCRRGARKPSEGAIREGLQGCGRL